MNKPKVSHGKPVAIALAALSMLGVVVAAFMLGARFRSPAQAAADAAPPSASIITAVAEQRVLVEPVVLRGKIQPGASVKILPPPATAGDSAVVTKVYAKTGEALEEGSVLIEIAGRPVIALALPFPLYRDLTGGVSGPDVQEVQRALGRLGHKVRPSGVFDAATQQALTRFLGARGYEPFPPSADAAARLEQARTAEVTARAEYDAAVAAGNGATAAKARLDAASKALTATELSAGPALPRSALINVDQAGRTLTAMYVKVGTVLKDPAAMIAELDSAAPFVTATAGNGFGELLTVGQKATVYDEVAGTKAEAVVAAVAKPDSKSAGADVRLEFTAEALAVADDRTVRVELAASKDTVETLAVPVTAVYAHPDGSTFVTVVASNATEDVPVTIGRIVGGWVAIVPSDPQAVTAGTPVVISDHDVVAKGSQ